MSTFRRTAALLLFAATTAIGTTRIAKAVQAADTYDIVVLNGRVIDPESSLDAIRNVGIKGSKIAALTTDVIRGTTTLQADGLVVAPGFIDLHQHARLPINAVNYAFKVMDGVTSSLELEIGTADVDGWYAARAGRAIINYGVSVGHAPIRMAVMGDSGEFLPSGPAANKPATPAEVDEIRRRFALGLQQGAVAAGFGLAYTPAASQWELLEMFKLAGQAGVSAHVHTRGSASVGLLEAVALASVTGTPLQVVHVQSTGGAETAQLLDAIRQARGHGPDVTAETYPYVAGASQIESALFNDWESYTDDRFQRFLWPATGERLTRATFAKYRKVGGLVITFGNTESVIMSALADPLTMVASDGNNTPGEPQHPRTAGTFARVLGHYVREEKMLSLMDALRKMTLMPAQRLEHRVPTMANKGRVRVGADADLTVFDPGTIIDRATYEKPAQYSAGIKDVLVNGVVVVRDGRLGLDVFPGQAIRAPLR